MSHSTADNISFEIDGPDDPYRGLRAKPEDRITRGFDMEKYFGILAGLDEEEDDHPGTTDALAASGRVIDPCRDLPRAKPGELPTRGFDPEKILGICADELDDEFLEEVMVPSSRNAAREKRS
jgi:hypothetical protein